ncbi:Protein TWK-49 b [Aphelenchoides avenae]|nr:Protein TWK-49 b [Aphelenchus avenae]
MEKCRQYLQKRGPYRAEEVLDNVRKRIPKVPETTQRRIRRIGPLILVVAVLVYLLLGAAAFLFFEHTDHEHDVRRFYLNLAVNRRQTARRITNSIFNDTRNMLIIVDMANKDRIQESLVNSLREYEQQLTIQVPNRHEWTLANSFNYAWGLLTTIGHGNRSPKTAGGQMFAMLYSLLGVPFYLGTLLILAYKTFGLVRNTFDAPKHRLNMVLISIGLYLGWILFFGFVLFFSAIPDCFWRSLYTAALSSLTIQSADYNAFDESEKVVALAATTVSIYLAALLLCFLTGFYDRSAAAERRRNNNKVAADPLDRRPHPPPRFQVIVDEVGEAKLAKTPELSPVVLIDEGR